MYDPNVYILFGIYHNVISDAQRKYYLTQFGEQRNEMRFM